MTDRELIELARQKKMTPEEREEQRRNFAYGSGVISNPRITRKSVDKVAEEMKRTTGKKSVECC